MTDAYPGVYPEKPVITPPGLRKSAGLPQLRHLHLPASRPVNSVRSLPTHYRMAAVDKDFTALQDERKRAEGVAADLQHAVFDQELYGGSTERFAGYDRSIGLADTEEEMDEREQAVRRYAGLCLAFHNCKLCVFMGVDRVSSLLINVLKWIYVSSQQNAIVYCSEVCDWRLTH